MAIDSYARQLAQIAMNKGGSGGTGNETDPTVPEYIKQITEEQINKWDNASRTTYIEINNTDYPESNPFDLETLKPGMWLHSPKPSEQGYVKAICPSNGEYKQCQLKTDNVYDYNYSYLYLGDWVVQSTTKYMEFLRFRNDKVTGNNSASPILIESCLVRIFVSSNPRLSINTYPGWDIVKDAISASTTKTITAIHTYNKLPKSTVAPTDDSQFTNKKYVDDAISNAITDALGGEY